MAIYQGVSQMVSGAGLMTAAPIAECATGVACAAAGATAIVGAAVAVQGVATAGTALGSEAAMLMAQAGPRSSTQGHHPWPKYLRGPNKQPLIDLPTKLHEKYHAGLDKIFPRWEGTQDWSKLTLEQQREIVDTLREYSKDFDAANNTGTVEALEDALKAAGVIP